ncbi:MAG TPA: DUF4153 domain-containing protein [Telluria sp.]|nr:DUF4153 domain-containing protein [Telluria sp.]
MNTTNAAALSDTPGPFARPAVGTARLLTGLLQGVLLYLLFRAGSNYTWPATEPLLFAPLVLVCVLVPAIAISSLGHMNRRQLLVWAGTAALIIAALAFYDIWRVSDAAAPSLPDYSHGKRTPRTPSPVLIGFMLAGFFIAHSLVLAGVRERRRIASYQSHYDIAWKLVVQLAFSGAFVGAVWLALLLGAQLFLLVKLDFLKKMIEEPAFSIPASTFAFACAIHLTDVRPAIVQGIRALLLTLMSWVLPVITLIVGAFVLTLPFTGLGSLWATGHATAVLLGAAAALVVLINAAWQDGSAPASAAPLIRASARAAAVLLLPLVAIALYALALRVGDYGWTVERIIAAACILVASCYAFGYAAGALRGGWLTTIPHVNIATAFVVLGTLLLLFSPLADPARLSVANQVARLESGKVPLEKFDFAYLQFQGARYGRDALARIESSAIGSNGAATRQRIANVRKMRGEWDREMKDAIAPGSVSTNLAVWPKGAQLPESFQRTDWSAATELGELPACLRRSGAACDAILLDVTGDGKQEVILVGTAPGGGTAVMGQEADGKWRRVGHLSYYAAGCPSIRKDLIEGRVRPAAPQLQDIEVGGARLRLHSALDHDDPCVPAELARRPAAVSGPRQGP